jgi:hypothetical protein
VVVDRAVQAPVLVSCDVAGRSPGGGSSSLTKAFGGAKQVGLLTREQKISGGDPGLLAGRSSGLSLWPMLLSRETVIKQRAGRDATRHRVLISVRNRAAD